jgi:hypothetical protein
MTDYSREIVIDTAPSLDSPTCTMRLVEITEGEVSTANGTRWQQHRWGVRFHENGAVHGRQFRSLEDARKDFEKRAASNEQEAPITLAALDEAFDD